MKGDNGHLFCLRFPIAVNAVDCGLRVGQTKTNNSLAKQCIPVVADEFREQSLSKQGTVELLRKLLGAAAEHDYVSQALQRIEDADEFELWPTMSQESIAAMDLCDALEGRQ